MEDGESRDSGCGYWTSDDGLGSRNQNQGHMEVRQMLADADVGASTGASLTSGAASAAPQTDQSREQSQHALIVQAARAMLDLQQLQWECEALNCGLLPSIFEAVVESCRALPVFERLNLFDSIA